MSKWKSILVVLVVCGLAACFPFSKPLHKKTCSLSDADFSSNIAVLYDDDDNVQTLEYTFHQKFAKDVVADMNEKQIVKTLESIFKRDNNDNINVEVTYDRKKGEGIVKVSTDVEDLSEDELEYYGLKEETKIKNVLDGAKKQGYDCEDSK